MAEQWIDVDEGELDELIEDYGEPFIWYKATVCPCTQGKDKRAASTQSERCPHRCIDGQIYRRQEIGDNVRAAVTDYNKTTYSPEHGRIPSGTAKWIAMVKYLRLGDRDRIVLTGKGREEIVRQVLRRGTGGPGTQGNDATSDQLLHPHVIQMVEVSHGFTLYVEGRDYALVGGELETKARLAWLDGEDALRPPDGAFYSVEYLRQPRLVHLSNADRPARANRAGLSLAQRTTLTILPLAKE